MKAVALVAAIAALTGMTSAAQAQSIIKQPGAHPKYIFEAEPHMIFRDRHGHGDFALGPGFRGTVVILDRGFIGKLNDSVGIGFGFDWLAFGGDHCHGRRNPPRDYYCDEHSHDQILLPVVLQWNFWLHRSWSVFGEPGFAMVLNPGDDDDFDDDDHDHDDDIDFDPFVFYAGGRFHFSDAISLTMRIGFPFGGSVGVSFLL